MRWREDAGRFLGKLEPGEELFASLLEFFSSHELPGATLSGLGAVNHARIGIFSPEKKRYIEKEFRENLEVVSLTGNIAQTPDGPTVHAHVALGRVDYSMVGGHLFTATVSVTLEVALTPTVALLQREPDPRFDLKLLRLD